nr:hypothetical protein [Thermogemmatispora sp.]
MSECCDIGDQKRQARLQRRGLRPQESHHLQIAFEAQAPGRVRTISVTFEPGARTAWHSHPLGQMLIVTAGCGRAQRWGGFSKKSAPVMLSGLPLERTTGTAQLPQRP